MVLIIEISKDGNILAAGNQQALPHDKKLSKIYLGKNAMDWTDSAYIATENNGQPGDIFCYSVNTADNVGFLRFVVVDKTKRGKGYGKEMLNMALQYAFQITWTKAVQLNVFSENALAKQCFEKIGFVKRKMDKDVFSYKNKFWRRCNMIISKQLL